MSTQLEHWETIQDGRQCLAAMRAISGEHHTGYCEIDVKLAPTPDSWAKPLLKKHHWKSAYIAIHTDIQNSRAKMVARPQAQTVKDKRELRFLALNTESRFKLIKPFAEDTIAYPGFTCFRVAHDCWGYKPPNPHARSYKARDRKTEFGETQLFAGDKSREFWKACRYPVLRKIESYGSVEGEPDWRNVVTGYSIAKSDGGIALIDGHLLIDHESVKADFDCWRVTGWNPSGRPFKKKYLMVCTPSKNAPSAVAVGTSIKITQTILEEELRKLAQDQ